MAVLISIVLIVVNSVLERNGQCFRKQIKNNAKITSVWFWNASNCVYNGPIGVLFHLGPIQVAWGGGRGVESCH